MQFMDLWKYMCREHSWANFKPENAENLPEKKFNTYFSH